MAERSTVGWVIDAGRCRTRTGSGAGAEERHRDVEDVAMRSYSPASFRYHRRQTVLGVADGPAPTSQPVVAYESYVGIAVIGLAVQQVDIRSRCNSPFDSPT